MPNKDSLSKLTVRCVGDIAPIRETPRIFSNTDASEFARQLSQSLPNSDLTVANLEAPVVSQAAPRVNKRYNLRTHASALSMFGPRSVVSLANNHIMDYGEHGLIETINALNARGIVHAGAGRNLEEASKPAQINIDGVRVAVLCCADPRFHAATAHRAGTCPATVELIDETALELRSTADIVMLSVHMGIEFLPVPSQRQLELAEVCARAGVSVLHFHHAHTISGIQNIGKCTVLFGTGNFLFPYIVTAGHSGAWHRSAVWTVDIMLEKRQPTSRSVSWIPLRLNNEGLPATASKRYAKRIDRDIRRWSERIRKRRALQVWRLLYVLRPGYLWLAAVNYGDMIRRQGLSYTAREFGRGLRASFTNRS